LGNNLGKGQIFVEDDDLEAYFKFGRETFVKGGLFYIGELSIKPIRVRVGTAHV